MNLIAERMNHIAPFYVMELLEEAQKLEAGGKTIVHMEVGEPAFSLPQQITTATANALAQGKSGYTTACGLPELRKAVSRYYKDYDVDISPERVIITPGSSGALQLIIGAAINVGEEVLLPDPTYPCNRHFVLSFGGIPKNIAVGPESNYQLTADIVQKHWGEKTKAVMVATPSNPTGTLIEKEELAKIYQVVEERGGLLIVDEIYQKLLYQTKGYSALSISENLVVLNSFSKYFGMTGLRVGWLVAPQKMIDPLARLAQNFFISPPAPSQYAALAAMEPQSIAFFEKQRQEFEKRRDFLYPALLEMGFKIPVMPEGAFYIYADCSQFSTDSYNFCHKILQEAGVAITPGKDFGFHKAENYVRLAYTRDMEMIIEGVKRLKQYLQN